MFSDVDTTFIRLDLVNGVNSIDDDKTVWVVEQIVNLLQQNLVILFEITLVVVEHFDSADNCGLLYVGVVVLEPGVNALLHVL